MIVCFRKGVKEREKETDTAVTAAAAPENVPLTDYTPTRPQHGRGSSSSTFFLGSYSELVFLCYSFIKIERKDTRSLNLILILIDINSRSVFQ